MTERRRRQFLKAAGSVGILLGAGTATATPGKRAGASAPDTIFDIVEGSPDFDTLESALEATGLDDVLDGHGGQYTVFGPTDAAFSDVDTAGLTTAELRNVLLYHVTSGRRYEPSVVNAPQLRMRNGDTVSVDGTTLNGSVEITATNIEASNGVIHVIDGVLLP
jgi:uncharacterized surface protein with fasciclin (FAS1) repeats